ncbi:hypothetical protein CEXT_595881 [Caerostris extrusa]|uniref:Uncharacterized protein n=1 Tax=Caerostris extrusa TaxID=172846 RepID=A0AAV4XZ27_CAEEX|nr:hypothetical protein CEXT_595881 [Caerostris extrusa]
MNDIPAANKAKKKDFIDVVVKIIDGPGIIFSFLFFCIAEKLSVFPLLPLPGLLSENFVLSFHEAMHDGLKPRPHKSHPHFHNVFRDKKYIYSDEADKLKTCSF